MIENLPENETQAVNINYNKKEDYEDREKKYFTIVKNIIFVQRYARTL